MKFADFACSFQANMESKKILKFWEVLYSHLTPLCEKQLFLSTISDDHVLFSQ